MMPKFFILLFLIFSFTVRSSCIPTNNLKFYPKNNKSSFSKKRMYQSATKEILHMYRSIIQKKFNAKLVIAFNWNDPTVNAYASRPFYNLYRIDMLGGLMRHPDMHIDAYRAVVCHELGHQIGGAPRKGKNMLWPSVEGQADYFATNKCLNKLFVKQKNPTLMLYNRARTSEELFAKNRCNQIFRTGLQRAACYRSSMAGGKLAKFFGSFSNDKISFRTPSSRRVFKVQDEHPKSQCRMDTYLQGALCNKSSSLLPNKNDANYSYCNRRNGYRTGVRPRCWYRP